MIPGSFCVVVDVVVVGGSVVVVVVVVRVVVVGASVVVVVEGTDDVVAGNEVVVVAGPGVVDTVPLALVPDCCEPPAGVGPTATLVSSAAGVAVEEVVVCG